MTEDTLPTRTRILDACQRLFNESGPDAVTTAEIARTVGINEGNLYYYFKKKEHILVALFDAFESALLGVAATPLAARASEEAGVAYLRQWFNLMWEWRFFYRDSAAIWKLAPTLRLRNVDLADRAQADIRRVLEKLIEAGLLQAPPEQVDRLVVNAWIVSCYWLDYLHSRHNVAKVEKEHVDWGFSQVLSLFVPFFPQGQHD